MSSSFLQVRVPDEVKAEFIKKSVTLGNSPSDMLREMVQAFIEGRLSITLSEEQMKQKQELYKCQ